MHLFSESDVAAAAQGQLAWVNSVELQSDIGNLLKLIHDQSTYEATKLKEKLLYSGR